ncbi:hypothetical protein HanOQP8_Chr12g0444971 [Helianthus annuus]|nr:hypothetical protein HanOQP8_Chr12g0444971 [Helianthus annuus]
MHYRSKSEGVPRVAVSIAFADEDWYKTLSRRATLMIQLEERAIVAAGTSMLWVPRDPRAYPVYAHKGKAGYSLVNVFDPKVAGGMAVAALHEGEPGWISRIRDNFLHPSNESMTAYGNVVLGVAKDETDVDAIPTQEELVLLSSEESAGSSHDLIHHSSRAGPQEGPTQEPAGESAYVPLIVDPPAAAAQRKEARTKKREEKKAEDKKSTEEPAIAPIRKHSSNIKLLDYVISDSLSGLDAGVKRSAPNPDDDDTLIEMLAKKQKILEEKKRELDEQAAAVLSEKKLKMMGETIAPSESKGGARVEGAEIDWESSEATPQGTIYTRRGPPTPGGGGPSGSRQGPELRRVEGGGSWTDHNPACDDLPHVPHWGLTQGSRMDDLGNCHEFYSLLLPPAERLFQKNSHRLDLLDEHIHSGVNFFSTTQEIVRNWQSMGEDILEFEAPKKEFAAKREAFNSEKKGLIWRAEKIKDNQEYERLAAAHKEKETESQARIVALEKTGEEKKSQNKALELLVEDLGADCKWLLARGIPLIVDRLVKSDELAKYMFELGGAAYESGRKDGYGEGKAAALAKEKDHQFELFKVDWTGNYTAKRQEYEFLEVGILKAIEKLTRKGIVVENLKKVHEDADAETDGAGTSHQV